MHAVVKILLGFVFIAVGLGMFVNSVVPLVPMAGEFWINNFVIVVTGMIPAFLILIGLFVVWLEVDELKIDREIRKEEKEEKKKKK
jgi:hypothetical protein